MLRCASWIIDINRLKKKKAESIFPKIVSPRHYLQIFRPLEHCSKRCQEMNVWSTSPYNWTTFVMERKFHSPISQPRYVIIGDFDFFFGEFWGTTYKVHRKTPTAYIYFIFYQYFILASVRKLEHSPSLGSGIRPSRLRQPSTHSVSIVRSTALVKSATLESFLVPIAHK